MLITALVAVAVASLWVTSRGRGHWPAGAAAGGGWKNRPPGTATAGATGTGRTRADGVSTNCLGFRGWVMAVPSNAGLSVPGACLGTVRAGGLIHRTG
jgi:hypothetical protein